MDKISHKTLMGSKWTATSPIDREKHFVVTGIKRTPGQASREARVFLRPVISKQDRIVSARELEDQTLWKPGWQ